MSETTAAPVPVHTTVRYEGSIAELRGLSGFVVAHHPLARPDLSVTAFTAPEDVRHSVYLSRRPSEGGGVDLHNVRGQSLVVGPQVAGWEEDVLTDD